MVKTCPWHLAAGDSINTFLTIPLVFNQYILTALLNPDLRKPILVLTQADELVTAAELQIVKGILAL